MMNTQVEVSSSSESPYQRALSASKRARWELERDVLRGRSLEGGKYWLPDGLSLAHTLDFLTESERRFLSQVQGRSYANIFGLVERFIAAKVLSLSQAHWFDDQVALEALVRFSDEELKHQELFRSMERLAAREMPAGYQFLLDPNDIARVVLEKSTWAVLGLTCHIELFTLAHYTHSIEADARLSPLFKDVFLFHWKEESQHAILDELEWRREDATLSPEQRSLAVGDLIALVAAIDGLLQHQARADVDYFIAHAATSRSDAERERVYGTVLRAYRYQYIGSGIELTRFPNILFGLVSVDDAERIKTGLAPLLGTNAASSARGT